MQRKSECNNQLKVVLLLLNPSFFIISRGKQLTTSLSIVVLFTRLRELC